MPKSAEQHKADGTYRADRHAPLEGPPPPPALDLAAPQSVSEAGLSETWDIVISDLSAMGTLCRTDLVRLEKAMLQLARNAMWSERLVLLLDDSEASESDRTKVQGNINSTLTSFNSNLESVEASILRRPRQKTADYLARI